MSLHFLEGFGAYSAGAHAVAAGEEMRLQFSNWVETPAIVEITNGSQGRKAYLTSNTGADNDLDMSMKLGSFDSTTIVVGFRFYHVTTVSRQCIFRFEDAGSYLGCLIIGSDGRFQYSKATQQNSDSGIPWSTEAIPTYTWTYVEAVITLSNTTGTVAYFINGRAVGTGSSLDTINTGTSCDGIKLANADAQSGWQISSRITDIYVDDSTRHGPMDIWYQPADTAGSAANFTPSAGSNHQNVDEIGADNDTTYNTSTATTTLDQIAHSDSLNVAPLALQPMVFARYVPTGSANIRVGLLSSTTHDQQTAEGLSDTYDGYRGKIYVTDPNTASAWTAGNADAAETTYEHAA